MRPRSSLYLVVLLGALAGCENDRPESLVICHNANCIEPTDPELDDTLVTLEESLSFTFDGRPLLDGVELDSFWKGDEDICLFAHDLDNAERAPATAAAEALAEYIGRPGPITYSGQAFHVFIELKSTIDETGTQKHSPQQRLLHADCAWEMYEIIADTAVAESRDVSIVFTSFEPALLVAMRMREPADTPVPVRFGAIQGIPLPLDGQTNGLDKYEESGIEVVEMHPGWMTDGQFEAIQSADLELVFWMFEATVEIFAAIDRYEPAMIETSEARLMRGWLEY